MRKTHTTLFFLFFTTIFIAQNKQTFYKSELDFGNGIIFSTFFNIEKIGDQYSILSPENADVRMFGSLKAKMGRILGKSPKKGIIIKIDAQQKGDSLFGNTNIPAFGKLKFKGIVNKESLSGIFISEDTTSIGTLKGEISLQKRNDYKFLYPKIIETIQDNIYSKDVLKNDEWEKFKKNIENLSSRANDDIELFLGFNIFAQKLPFTHLNLFISKDNLDAEDFSIDGTNIVFEEKNNSTAYILIKNFSSSKKELSTILPKIVENENYKNLIVDLRDNGGGGIEAAFEFAKYITDKDIEVGYFVTNKLKYSGYQPELFKTLTELQPKSTKDFTNDLKTLSGVKLIFNKPENKVFKGNIYLLTNGKTASTCEPIVYALKTNKKATIIGEKTAGAMLAAFPFSIPEKYVVMLPIADFYTFDGIRLDKVGVSPDVETKSEDALNKAMEIISLSEKNK